MSWLSLAIGLIREAATTEAGQDILNDVRSRAAGGGTAEPRKSQPHSGSSPDTDALEAWMRSLDRRIEVADRNAEILVGMLNAQNEALIRVQKRQRIWNLTLAGILAWVLGTLAWGWLT